VLYAMRVCKNAVERILIFKRILVLKLTTVQKQTARE